MMGRQQQQQSAALVWVAVNLLLLVAAQQPELESQDRHHWWNLAQNELEAALNVRDNVNIAKNVILFLGDGMGITANTAGRIYKGQKKGMNGEEGYLTWERFPNAALLKTYNVDKQVPDSAATATAFLCGVKSNYYTLGVDSAVKYKDCNASLDTAHHLSSILQWAQEQGMATGLVTTTRITHATPAALYAHTAYRYWECDGNLKEEGAGCKDIADQLITENPGKNIKVIMGGGRRTLGAGLDPNPDPKTCTRQDGRDLTQEWLKDKYHRGHTATYATTAEEMREVEKTDFFLGLFSDSHLPYMVERESNTSVPTLKEMTLKAIDLLKNPEGFFLLVEGGRIDHGLHRNSPYRFLEEILAMDDAVAAALAEVNLEDTLVLVTADHSHVLTINGYPDRGNDILGVTGYPSKKDGLNYTTLLFTNGPGFNYSIKNKTVTRLDPNDQDTRDLDYKSLAAVPRKSETHGGEDVAIWAAGPMAHLLHRTHEQHYVAHVMAHAAAVGPSAHKRLRKGYPAQHEASQASFFPVPPRAAYPQGTSITGASKTQIYPSINPGLQQVIAAREQQMLEELGLMPVHRSEEIIYEDYDIDD